jgi:tetratricopeptide (TPR) repeat protein
VLARQGRYEDALDAVQKESDLARAYNVLGKVAQEAGDLERARQLFSDAISAAPRWFQEAQDNLAAVNERLLASKASGSPLASTVAGGDPASRVHADPLSVPVGYWLSQDNARAAAKMRRQTTAGLARQPGNRVVKSP